MSTSKKIIKEQKEFLFKLSKGIDPTTNICFEEDTILNNVYIKKTLGEVYETLNVLFQILDENKLRKNAFFILEDEIDRITPSSEPITISKIAFFVNQGINRPNMKKLRATEITQWLENEGLLKTVDNDGFDCRKIPTDKGLELGIIKVEKINSIGKMYTANLYNENAQRYVIENLPNIMEWLSKEAEFY